MTMNLSTNCKFTRVNNAAAAGTTDVESASVDMQNFNAVCFVVSLGAITASAVTDVHLEGSTDDSTFNDLAGTAQTVADDDDNQIWILDLRYPTLRYIRCVVDRGTANAVVDGIVAIQYQADFVPVTHDSTTVGGSEINVGVAAGTK